MRVKRQERKGVKSLLFASQKKSCSIIVHLPLIITIADYQLFCKRAPPQENKQNGLQPRGEFQRFIESQKQEELSLNKRMNITNNNLPDTIMIHYTDLMDK